MNLAAKVREDQEEWSFCWRTALMWESEASTAREIGAPGSGWVRTGTEARRSFAWRKAESRAGDQGRDLPGPLRALVRGARTRAALRRNLQSKLIIPRKR